MSDMPADFSIAIVTGPGAPDFVRLEFKDKLRTIAIADLSLEDWSRATAGGQTVTARFERGQG